MRRWRAAAAFLLLWLSAGAVWVSDSSFYDLDRERLDWLEDRGLRLDEAWLRKREQGDEIYGRSWRGLWSDDVRQTDKIEVLRAKIVWLERERERLMGEVRSAKKAVEMLRYRVIRLERKLK